METRKQAPHPTRGTTSPRNLTVRVASREPLDVRHFRVEEHMSALFEVHLEVVSEQVDLDLDAIVGHPAQFEVAASGDARRRSWAGICRDAKQVHAEPAGLSTYALTLVPSLWLLTRRRNYRIFQQVSEIEIVKTLLAEWGIRPALRLSSTYLPRPYRVQYAESDYAFVSRLLEDVGVSYHFRDDGDDTVLVLSDAPQSAEPLPAPVRFGDHLADQDRISHVSLKRQVTPGRFAVRDHDTRLPSEYALLAAASSGSKDDVEARLEQFDYQPGAFLFSGAEGSDTPAADDRGVARSNAAAANEVAARRLDAARGERHVVDFETNASALQPGVVFAIGGHPRADLSEARQLLVVGASHHGAHDGDWHHTGTARFADVPHRPAHVTPRPRVNGVENGTVVGPPGDEIHVDELGRVRVHFHWDRGSQRNEKSSCWVPVSQPWGGAGYGGTNLPRIGQEVIIDFLGGDPDRPMITGRIYTSQQKTPYKLPDNKTQSGWKSCSTNATGGYNELMFEDASGRELVRMQAERDLDKLVKHDERVVIGHDRTKLVKNDDTLTVSRDRRKTVDHDEGVVIGHDRRELVGNDEDITVGRDRSELVKKNEDITIGGNRAKTVQKNEREVVLHSRTRLVGLNEAVAVGIAQQLVVGMSRTVQVGVNQNTTVGRDKSTSVGKNDTLRVGGSRTETVALAKALSVGAAYQITVGGVMNTTVAGAQSEQVGMSKSVVAGTSITLTCGRSSLVMDKAGVITWAIEGGASIVIDDKNVTITAAPGGAVVIQGGPEVHLNP